MRTALFALVLFLLANTAYAGLYEDDRGWYIWEDFQLPSGMIYRALKMIQSKTPDSIEGWIRHYARQYGVDEEILVDLAMCESKMKIDARGDWRSEDKIFLANGLFQFWERTFNAFRKESGMTWLKYDNWKHQTELAAWAWANGKEKHWWNCRKFILASR